MNPFRRLFDQFKAYHDHGRPIIQYTGMVGIAAFPLFYLMRFTKADPPYNDLWLRLLASLICTVLALRSYWPSRLKPYYLAYAYGALLYCMPFFFIFSSLNAGGGSVAVSNTFVAVFFLILLSDWRNTVFMLVTGAALAALLYVTVSPKPTLPADYLGRLPMLVLVVVGGSLFKFAQKQAEAEKIKRTYTALAGSIAHEMRNPLTQVKHNLEGMQQALPSPATTALDQARSFTVAQVDTLYRHLAESEMAVRRGLQVIAMTLDEVSERPMDTAAFSYLSAAEATYKAVREYGWDNEEDRRKVRIQVAEDFTFRGDETAYLFVLFNLMKNALYYMALDAQARLTITIERQRVEVHDSGPGIAPEALPRLFEPFRSTGKSGGTGLGLSYCQRVMRGFGGQISCESVEGEYTQFALHFPSISNEEREAHRLAVLERVRNAFAGKRLLIVDDDAAQRMTTRHKLQVLDAGIDEAANGRRALEMLAKQRYDLVLLDLNMPLLDGYAVAEKIRQGCAPQNRDVRIVAHTSEPAHLAIVKTQKAGMDGFVGKPCAQLPLLQALEQALAHPATRYTNSTLLAGRRILLADDSSCNRVAVAAYLQHAGATVVQAANGPEVLAQLPTSDSWDAILMDINMPGMSGFETTQAIRSSAMPWSNVPIIAVTAHSDEETIRRAQAAGMNDLTTKPVEAAVLYAKLGQLINGETAGTAAAPGRPKTVAADDEEALLNLERLESFRRIGMLRELLNDYLPEIARVVARLERSVAMADLQESIDALHSLLGMSGEAGAQALHRLVRQFYVPMIELRTWPTDEGWLAHIKAAAARAEKELMAYDSTYSTVAAG